MVHSAGDLRSADPQRSASKPWLNVGLPWGGASGTRVTLRPYERWRGKWCGNVAWLIAAQSLEVVTTVAGGKCRMPKLISPQILVYRSAAGFERSFVVRAVSPSTSKRVGLAGKS